MKPTLNKLLTDPKYKLRVETQYGYYSSRFGFFGVPYKGVYGQGYRVYVADTKKKKDGKYKITIYYFIEKDEE